MKGAGTRARFFRIVAISDSGQSFSIRVYSYRDEDWLREQTLPRTGQTSPLTPPPSSPFLFPPLLSLPSFVSSRPRLFIQQIFSSYFSIPLLLYCFPITARHRSFLLSAGNAARSRCFPLFRPRFVSALPPPVICRENWLRNIFNCPSIFNGEGRRREREKERKIPDRSFLSISFPPRRDAVYTRSFPYQKLSSTKRKMSPRWNQRPT